MNLPSPSKVQARKIVLASIFVLAAVSVYKDRKGPNAGQQGTGRVLWGVGVVGIFLSLLADVLPQIAGPFAALVALGSLTNGGEQVIAKALGLIGPPASAGPGQPPGQGTAPSGTTVTRTGPNTQTAVTTGPGSTTIVQQTGP